MKVREKKEESIPSLRKVLGISNLANLKNIVPGGAFRMSTGSSVNPYVLGVWIRLCQIAGNDRNISAGFDSKKIYDLVGDVKYIMCQSEGNLQEDLRNTLGKSEIMLNLRMSCHI